MRLWIPVAVVCAVMACNVANDREVVQDPDLDVPADVPVAADASDPGPIQTDIPMDTTSGPISTTAQEVSPCGGFTRAKAAEPLGYCDAEVLRWSFEESTRALSLVNARVSLNCCGDHSMRIEGRDGVYTATETDAPKDGTQRCKCTCVYDFMTTGAPVAGPGPIVLTLLRNVTDLEDQPKTVWTGTLDLSTGSGILVIDPSPVPMGCEPSA